MTLSLAWANRIPFFSSSSETLGTNADFAAVLERVASLNLMGAGIDVTTGRTYPPKASRSLDTLVMGFLSMRPQAGICQKWSQLVSKLSCLTRAKGGNSFLSHLRPVMGRAQGVTGSLQSPLRGPRFIRLVAGVSHLLDPLLTEDPDGPDLQHIPL